MPHHYTTPESDYQPSNNPHVLQVISSGHGPGTFVPFELIAITGDAATAILFSQMLYWAGKMHGQQFYKSVADWHAEIKLSERVIRRIIRGDKRSENGKPTIQDLGVEVEVHRANGAPTYHYRINYRKLGEYLHSYYSQSPDDDLYTNGTNPHTPMVQGDLNQWYKSITEDYTEDYTTHAAPDKPSRASDEKQPTQQQMLVGALFDAFDITAPTGPDRTKAGKVAKELAAVGVAAEDVPDLVAFVRRQAAGQWTVTMMSLIGNGRVSQYLQAKERTEQAVTMVTEDDWNPAAHIGTPEEVEAGRLRVEGSKLLAQGILPNPNWRDRLPDYMRDND